MAECPVVVTKLGELVGRLCAKAKPANAKQVYNYPGVPFAKPPVGDLRFEAPVKPEPWDGVLQATENKAAPIQDMKLWEGLEKFVPCVDEFGDDFTKMSEDCLYLNVFTTNPDPTANMPVMVWFYGGGFMMGNTLAYNGQVLASLNDVVVVVPAYRVNALGFLSLGTDTKWTGNMGLLDQVMALEWTRDHIEGFGGDPNNVTIFGESAGGNSVGLHWLSPLSRGLFHKAISSSGVANLVNKQEPTGERARKALLEHFKISETDPEEIMKKLKQIPIDEYVTAQQALAQVAVFGPIQGDAFTPRDINEMIGNKEFVPVPYMIGFNSTESNGILQLQVPGFAEGFSEVAVKPTVRAHLSMMTTVHEEKLDAAVDLVIKEYSKDLQDDDKFRWSKMIGGVMCDLWFGSTSMISADANAVAGNPTYVYHMSHQLRLHHDAEYGGDIGQKPDFCECDHGDDMMLTFGMPLTNARFTRNLKFTRDEEKLSEIWMRYLANFAKTGNPNNGAPVPVEWPSYCESSGKYLAAKMPVGTGDNLLKDKMKFWNETIPNM